MTRDDLRPTMNDNLQFIKRHERYYGKNINYINNRYIINILLFIDNDEVRMNRLESLKMAIETNQLTIDVCDKFIDEMDNLKSEEMKEIGKIIVNKIMNSSGNEQKIRCEQTLAFIDRLTICNDSIWIHYYR